MRIAGRVLLAALSMVLTCGAIGALSGGRADFPERGAAFHKPHHPSPAIEIATVSAPTSSTDEGIAAPPTGVALKVRFGSGVPASPTSRAISPALAAALDQRPPPRTPFA